MGSVEIGYDAVNPGTGSDFGGSMKRQLAALVLLASTTPLAAQWLSLATPGIPRTADGEPDLSAPVPRSADGHPDLAGLWVPRGVSGDLFDPSKVHEWARTLMAERERHFFDDNPRFHCLPTGPAYLTLSNTATAVRRIVQHPNVIAFLNGDLTYRQIFTDGRTLEPNPHPTWTGYSVGRWDGDALIVESNGFNDKTWLHRRGLGHTESLRITERYRRLDFGHLQLEVTYEDPGTFDSPLHANVEMELAADDEMLEEVCNEASEGRSHWGGAVTDAEAAAVEVAPEILEAYVGTYRGYWSNSLITVEVILEDGTLVMQRSGRGNRLRNGDGQLRLFPRSETTFECSCGWGYIFTRGDEGMATQVAEVHVTGAYTFMRVF